MKAKTSVGCGGVGGGVWESLQDVPDGVFLKTLLIHTSIWERVKTVRLGEGQEVNGGAPFGASSVTVATWLSP